MGETYRIRKTARIALLFATILALAAAAVVTLTAAPAQAKPCDPYFSQVCRPVVRPTIHRRDPLERTVEVKGTFIRRNDRIPFTGADLTLFAVTGVAAIGTGGILVRAARVRRGRA
ncbi:MAG: hypothetical protein M3271_11645 [Actinomycetota bacterium]|nr:hypothetical protein [Actinomycetota bacterium]